MAAAAVYWVWNWSGDCAGYLEGDDLWTTAGRHVGRLHGIEIYDRHGVYLGDLMNENRLIFFTPKKQWYGAKFSPHLPCEPCRGPGKLPALPMPPGCRDVMESDSLP